MNEFFSWDMLGTYAGAVTAVSLMVQFTKGLPFIKALPTQAWSYALALVTLLIALPFILCWVLYYIHTVVIFPSILSEFISVLSGSLIIEKIFGINGVGGLYLNSITFQDYDFFMLLSGFYTLVSLAAGIVIDISYGFIDPRIRMGAK